MRRKRFFKSNTWGSWDWWEPAPWVGIYILGCFLWYNFKSWGSWAFPSGACLQLRGLLQNPTGQGGCRGAVLSSRRKCVPPWDGVQWSQPQTSNWRPRLPQRRDIYDALCDERTKGGGFVQKQARVGTCRYLLGISIWDAGPDPTWCSGVHPRVPRDTSWTPGPVLR